MCIRDRVSTQSTGAKLIAACSEIVELDCAPVATVERVEARRAVRPGTAADCPPVEPVNDEAFADAGVYGEAMAYAQEQMQGQRDSFLARAKQRASKAREAGKQRRSELEDGIQLLVEVRQEMDSTIAACVPKKSNLFPTQPAQEDIFATRSTQSPIAPRYGQTNFQRSP
eukprot:TRINITY_DN27488_c0_g1_i3.p1 TRINITY_DN27488_c0_g1~~TRINITY_DN27488_c0_g1_i3.p1  ORF type:complete len:170 (+),score=32.23 TRINITY_DN27488_c0_g1_i3:122-631(+)